MKSRLPDLPVLKIVPGVIGAANYNRVRLAFTRLGAPQELLLGLRGLHFRLDRQVWICSDRRLNDTPLIAWTEFENGRRLGVHSAVRCQVFYYHAYARVIAATVLTEVDRRLESLLRESREAEDLPAGSRVVSFTSASILPR